MLVNFNLQVGTKIVECQVHVNLNLTEIDGVTCYEARYLNITTTGATPRLAVAAMIDKLSN